MPAPYRIAEETYAIPSLRQAPPRGVAHFTSFLGHGMEPFAGLTQADFEKRQPLAR